MFGGVAIITAFDAGDDSGLSAVGIGGIVGSAG